jgi:mRNA interferase MazF
VICERFETVVVSFPFAEKAAIQRRPAVVISGQGFNRANGATVVAMITTAKTHSWPSDHLIQEQATAGLAVSCVIRWRLATLPNALLLKKLGALGLADAKACIAPLQNMSV